MASATRSTILLPPALSPTKNGSATSIFAVLSQILGTHAVLAFAGLLALPVLARNLGPASYGTFSIYLTVLGVLSTLDYSRRLFVRELAAKSGERVPLELDALGAATAFFLGGLGLIAGLLLFGPLIALGLGGSVFLHALASRDYAQLAIAGQVGRATGVRNVIWAVSTLMVAAGSMASTAPGVFVFPFLLGNLAILVTYRVLVVSIGAGGRWSLFVRTRDLRSGWMRLRGPVGNLLGFGAASAVMVAADRVLLERNALGQAVGEYVANGDLVLKLTLFGTALASVLDPHLARLVAEQGKHRAAQRFVHIATLVVSAYFAGVVALLVFDRQVTGFLLGSDYAAGRVFYDLFLVGIFVQVFGYLIGPWQRARGEFEALRRAYTRAAVLMVAACVILIPVYGARGAIIAYLLSRFAEVSLLVGELRHFPRNVLPVWKLCSLGALTFIVAIVAGTRILS